MNDIAKIDKNFAIDTRLDMEDICFYDACDLRFSLYGVFYENGMFRRLPEAVAQTVSEGVYRLHTNTAGGRLKFITDSPYVAIKAAMPGIGRMSDFALTGSAGFDLYVGKKETYYGTFAPSFHFTDGYESVIRFTGRALREITINFPLYSSVSSLYIGLAENAVIKRTSGYKYKKPVVFYGSSITQGGCASRPGMAYTSTVARQLQTDHWNLGFSGSAKAEDAIRQYIQTLSMSVFVYDYDHNAPSLQHLADTHQKMFAAIRRAQPELPIIILSRPKYNLSSAEQERLDIIRKTYTDALAAGDKNVYLIEGPTLMKYAKDNGTVDGTHPNDLGFYSMAKVLAPQLKKLLLSKK